MTPAGFFWCTLFFLLGPSLILLNNHVLNTVHFKYPVFFSSLGIWGTFFVSQIAHRMGWIQVKKQISLDYWLSRIVPVGILSAATIGSGNSVYLFLSVSFTQMLKALTPVYILLCLVLFQVEIPSRNVVMAVAVISLGTMVASLGELKFSWTGFILQSLADLLEGSRLVLLQLLMSENTLSPVESIYFTAPATALGQLMLVLVYEKDALLDKRNWTAASNNWHLFLGGVMLGVAINFIGMFVIKHTSGLMLKLIGVVRNNCLVLLSVLFLGEKTTALQMIGYIVSIAGFVWYTNLTNNKSREKQATQSHMNKYTRLVEYEHEMDPL